MAAPGASRPPAVKVRLEHPIFGSGDRAEACQGDRTSENGLGKSSRAAFVAHFRPRLLSVLTSISNVCDDIAHDLTHDEKEPDEELASEYRAAARKINALSVPSYL